MAFVVVTSSTNKEVISVVELYNIFECSLYYRFSKEYEKDLLKLANIVLSILGEKMEIESRFELLDL